jgi:hypothetical protein
MLGYIIFIVLRIVETFPEKLMAFPANHVSKRKIHKIIVKLIHCKEIESNTKWEGIG